MRLSEIKKMDNAIEKDFKQQEIMVKEKTKRDIFEMQFISMMKMPRKLRRYYGKINKIKIPSINKFSNIK